MTSAQLTVIKNTVDRLGIPKNYQTAGFTHRLFTWNQYKPQQGLINLFLLSNIEPNRSLEEPLLSSQQNGTFTTMKISSMVSALQRPGAGIRYLDLETRTVITQAEAYALANAEWTIETLIMVNGNLFFYAQHFSSSCGSIISAGFVLCLIGMVPNWY